MVRTQRSYLNGRVSVPIDRNPTWADEIDEMSKIIDEKNSLEVLRGRPGQNQLNHADSAQWIKPIEPRQHL